MLSFISCLPCKDTGAEKCVCKCLYARGEGKKNRQNTCCHSVYPVRERREKNSMTKLHMRTTVLRVELFSSRLASIAQLEAKNLFCPPVTRKWFHLMLGILQVSSASFSSPIHCYTHCFRWIWCFYFALTQSLSLHFVTAHSVQLLLFCSVLFCLLNWGQSTKYKVLFNESRVQSTMLSCLRLFIEKDKIFPAQPGTSRKERLA